jgi:hypothetical protein
LHVPGLSHLQNVLLFHQTARARTVTIVSDACEEDSVLLDSDGSISEYK